jgi:predicted enzyme related to lactoylglutathione lyase
VKDFDRAVAFYGDTLGLHRSIHVPDRGFAEFETGNLTLSLIDPEKVGMEHRTGHNTIALKVDDVAAARAALESRGVELHGEIFDSGACHMTFFNDSEGNALMLHHRYAPRHRAEPTRRAVPRRTRAAAADRSRCARGPSPARSRRT